MSISLVMMGAGNSTRFEMPTKKQWLRIGSIPLWLYVTQKIAKLYNFDKIVVVGGEDELKYMQKFANFTFCSGGQTRQQSLKNALLHVKSKYVLVSDVARVCVNESLIERILQKKGDGDSIIPTLDIIDTLYYDGECIDRERAKRVQTPQLSNTLKLKEAINSKNEFTDESSAIKAHGGKVIFVKGDKSAKKLTSKEDLKDLKCLRKPSLDTFVGNGFDVHAFGIKRPLILGGVRVHESLGLKAHSDGDVLIHSLIDALLGAIGGGDIGELFPDTNEEYKNISSLKLLEKVTYFINSVGFEVVNCDITIMAQKPKISPYKQDIELVLAKTLLVEPYKINVKATTTEKLGFVGREEGIAVISNASLKYFDWTNL